MDARSNLVDGVIIPALQAGITAGLAGLAAGSVAGWFELSGMQTGLTVGALAGLTSWLNYRARWALALDEMHKPAAVETPPPAAVRVVLTQDEGRRGDYIDLPVEGDKLRALSDGLQAGRTFSQAVWTGNNGIFTRSEFEMLRAELLRRGLAKWRKEGAPGQGVELTAPGRAVIRRFSSEANHSPTPSINK